MEKFVKNLIEEHRSLFVKISNAEKFLSNPENNKNLDLKEYTMLYAQIEAMKLYYRILTDRIAYYNVAVCNENGKISYYEKVS